MARYFKFKSADELHTAATELGCDFKLQEDLAPLRQSAVIAGRIVGNRIAYQPMEGCDCTLDGRPDELTYRRFARFGAGGAKLIWGEAAAVVAEGRANSRQLVLIEPHVADFARLVETCRNAHHESMGRDDDLLIGIQLTHSGRFSYRQPVRVVHCPVLDGPESSASLGSLPKLLTDADLDELADRYVAAAKLARLAGFNFVDVKQCHRYLLGEILGARTRPGKYGGSLQNRVSFAANIVRRIRSECPELLIGTRMNAFDGVPFTKGPGDVGVPRPFPNPYLVGFGNNVEAPMTSDMTEPLAAIAELREAGICMFNISAGSPYFNPHLLRPAEYAPVDGYLPPEHPLLGVDRHFRLTAAVQQEFPDLALIGSGYSFLQEYILQAAAGNVASQRTTFAGLGRAILAYPGIVRDALETGKIDRKSICRTFSYCTNLMRSKNHPLGQFATGCPPFDKEIYHEIWEDAKRSALPAAPRSPLPQ